MDKLKAMRAFCDIVDAGSFAAAAKKANVVPSALSKALATLEHDLGFTLLVRSTRRLGLTQEGQLYYATCRRLLAELEDTELLARGARLHLRGVLRVGMHPSFSIVLRSMADLHAQAPSLQMEVSLTNDPSMLIGASLDVCLHAGPVPDCQLFASHLHDAQAVVCASPGYLHRHGQPLEPADLAGHRIVAYRRPDEQPLLDWDFVNDLQRQTVHIPAAMVLRDGVGLLDAALGGVGIARPLAHAAAPALDSGALVALLTDWKSPPYPLYALTPQPPSRLPMKTRLFLEHVRRSFD